jgi:hypothetical protein
VTPAEHPNHTEQGATPAGRPTCTALAQRRMRLLLLLREAGTVQATHAPQNRSQAIIVSCMTKPADFVGKSFNAARQADHLEQVVSRIVRDPSKQKDMP